MRSGVVLIVAIIVMIIIAAGFYFANKAPVEVEEENNAGNNDSDSGIGDNVQDNGNNSGNVSEAINISKTCVDGDVGKNYYILKNVTLDDVRYADYCIDNRTAMEYYCVSVSDGWEAGNVSYRCPSLCKNGACLE